MAEIKSDCPVTTNAFKEAVCIDAGRVYDSCCDRDCLEDLRCYFTCEDQSYIEQAVNIRAKSAEVAYVYIDVEPVSFNRGFFSCSLTFFFIIDFDVLTAPHAKPHCIRGTAFYEKKAILYGSEGSVKVFSNKVTDSGSNDPQAFPVSNMPKCVVQTVDPIVLSSRICEIRSCYDNVCCVPQCVCDIIGGPVVTEQTPGTPAAFVTLGLFSIVQLIRNVQMLVPVYDFCIPEKQCNDSTDQPCDVFRKIKFPTDDFFPPRPCDIDNGCGCGCSDDNNDD